MDVRGAGVWTVLRIRVIGPNRKEADRGIYGKRNCKIGGKTVKYWERRGNLWTDKI